MTALKILAISVLAVVVTEPCASQTANASPGEIVRLPRPTGEHRVGVRRFHWVDTARAEPGSNNKAARRGLVVRVWYPATGEPAMTETPYLPQIDAYRSTGLIGPRTYEFVKRVRHWASDSARILGGSGRFPVVIFSSGNGEQEYIYTTMMSDLASHGYILISIVHPGVGHVIYPDGSVLRRYEKIFDPKPDGWDSGLRANSSVGLRRAVHDVHYDEAARILSGDISFVIDQLQRLDRDNTGGFTGRIDLSRIATFGHSYGGNVAIEACWRDPRVRACAETDGGSFAYVRDVGLAKPLMILRPAFDNDSTPRGIVQTQLLGGLKADGYEVNIRGANHRSFMDAAFLDTLRSQAATALRTHAITSAYLTAFFAKYLQGRESSLLETRSPRFPDVYLRTLRYHFPDSASK